MNKMKRVIKLAGAVAILAAASNAMAYDKAATDKRTAEALAIAKAPGEQWVNGPVRLCLPLKEQAAYNAAHRDPDPGPVKVFDNLYFVGTGTYSSWAVTTSQGIIVIDTLNNAKESQGYILAGLRKLGLNPNDIKYVILTHAHGDHYGGAAEIQRQIQGVHVLMSAADWDYSAVDLAKKKSLGITTERPTHDMVITDGQQLKLGDEVITMYLTPGHTPGTVSLLIPVKDHGTPHLLAMQGGRPYPSKEWEAPFMASTARFRAEAASHHADGMIGNHSQWDNSLVNLAKIKADPSGPNPYLLTANDLKRFNQIQDLCLQNQHDFNN